MHMFSWQGLLHPEDALLALHHKVDAIVVSNHGGRQLDCAPSALEMLPYIVKAVRGRIPIIMDGGSVVAQTSSR